MDGNIKIAGLMSVKNYSDDCSAFSSLKALADVTIVLDDKSNQNFCFREECDEYVRLENRKLWNDIGNSTLLFLRAYIHGCRWIVWMDDDFVFSKGFQRRDDVEALIRKAECEGADVCLFALWDLWESKDRYRVDGVWGKKSFAVIRRNWFFDRGLALPNANKRLHRACFPRNKRLRQIWADHMVYHTGCFTLERRVRRVEKYRVEDPRNQFQRDYRYILDEYGLQLRDVPGEDRGIIEAKFNPEI